MKKLALSLFALFALAGAQALAQVIPQPVPPPGAIGCAYNVTPPTLTDTQAGQVQCDNRGGLIVGNSGGMPANAVAITTSATGTTNATAATLAAVSGKTTYICGFSIRANATAAATGNATVAGTITGTLNFTQWTAPLASGIGLVEREFLHCIPASATNTTIVITGAAPGAGGVISVSAWGYQL